MSARAVADPILHLQTPSTVTTDGGSNLRLPPGYFLDEPTMDVLDLEMKRLQDQENRLKAENESMRRSSKWSSTDWKVVGIALGAGFAAGSLLVLLK